jgi:hypothetical protein
MNILICLENLANKPEAVRAVILASMAVAIPLIQAESG